MPIGIDRANRVARILGDGRFQIDLQTVTLEMSSLVAIAASFPVLRPSASVIGAKQFTETVYITSVYLSTTFHGTAIAQFAGVAIARLNMNTNLNLLGDSQVFLQQVYQSTLATPPGTEIHRNLGKSIPSPLWPKIKSGEAISVFGSAQTAGGLSYYTTATIEYLRGQDIDMLQEFANG